MNFACAGHKARAVLRVAVACCATTTAGASGPSAHETSLCGADQRPVFSCSTSNRKRLAICATPPHEVQYRFGLPGKVEFVYPPSARDGPRLLRYAEYHRPLTNRYTLSFTNDGVEYSVFDFDEDGRSTAGVTVQRGAQGQGLTISCRGRPKGSLVPLKDLVACDRDSALNLGSCP